MRVIRSLMAAVLLALAVAACTPVSPEPDDTAPVSVLPDPAPELDVRDLALFSGVAMSNAGSNCTATLIDTGVTDGPAYALTNGHCTGDVGRSAQGVTVAEEWWGEVEFFRAAGNLDATLTVDVIELEYSTMRGRDLAIMRLDATLSELRGYGVIPVPIADAEPAPGTPVVNITVPVQDLPQDDWVMRRGGCTLADQHTVIEAAWLWFGAWANDCPGIIQGASGSPLFTQDADGAAAEIVAMINTTSWAASAGGECSMHRPCQVTADAATMVPETSYAVSVAGVGRCFDADGVFALGDACPLQTTTVWANRGGGNFRGGELTDSTGRTPEVSLVGSSAQTVRTALAPLGDGTVCSAAGTYAGAAAAPLPVAGDPWEDGHLVAPDLPEEEGRFVLCAVAGDDYAGAASVLFAVDRTPPIVDAGASVEDLGEGWVMVRPHMDPPELAGVRFHWGASGTIDCADRDAFQDFFLVPLTLGPDDLPATYCVYGTDDAGNPTPVVTIDIPRPTT